MFQCVGGHSHTHTCTRMLVKCARVHERPITLAASSRELITEEETEGRLSISVFFRLPVGGGANEFSLLSRASTCWALSHAACSVCPSPYVFDNTRTDLCPFPGLESTAFMLGWQCHIAIKVPNSLILTLNFSCVPEAKSLWIGTAIYISYFWLWVYYLLKKVYLKKILVTYPSRATLQGVRIELLILDSLGFSLAASTLHKTVRLSTSAGSSSPPSKG